MRALKKEPLSICCCNWDGWGHGCGEGTSVASPASEMYSQLMAVLNCRHAGHVFLPNNNATEREQHLWVSSGWLLLWGLWAFGSTVERTRPCHSAWWALLDTCEGSWPGSSWQQEAGTRWLLSALGTKQAAEGAVGGLAPSLKRKARLWLSQRKKNRGHKVPLT